MNNKIMGTVLQVFALPALLLGLVTMPTLAEGLQETELSAGLSETDSSDSDYIVDWTECGTCVWSIDSANGLVVKPVNGMTVGELTSFPWTRYRSQIRSVRFEGTVKVSSLKGAFSLMSELDSVDLSGLDTSAVDSMSSLFSGCYSLTSIDLSCIDTSNTRSMACMFSSCNKLTSINFSGIDTSKVTNMSYMFSDCYSIESLDLSGFDTSAVVYTSYMFLSCPRLAHINLASFRTSHVESMDGMFYGCSALISLDLTKFDTSTVSDFNCMFYDCQSLSHLDLSSFDTSNAVSMISMFYGCRSLTSLNLSNFKTLRAEKMAYMFCGCSQLKSINLSEFNTSNVSEMSKMFDGCSMLESIRLGSNFSFAGSKEKRLTSLPGDWWRSSVDNKAYASDEVPNNVAATYLRVEDISPSLIEIPDQVYTGAELKPQLKIVCHDEVLMAGIDYEVEYDNNIEIGIATVTVFGKGHYAGKAVSSFRIAMYSVSDAKVTVANQLYSGASLFPGVTVELAGRLLVENVDYVAMYKNNVNAGTASVTVSGKGDYIGSCSATFTISPADISGAQVSVDSEWTYTGSALTPVPTVALSGKTLEQGSDYDVSYSNNVNVGTATVAVTGKGNYTGTATTTFEIVAPPAPTPEPTPTPTITFIDVNSSTPHNEDISWLASAGVSTGWNVTGGKEFRPYANVARCDMAAFLYRLAGSPDYTAPGISPFRDCDTSTPHYKEICWLAEKGISEGWAVAGGKEFRPYATVARCDMAAFLYRMAGSPNYAAPSMSPFKDCNGSTPHYREVCWLAETGVSAGWDVTGGKEFRSYNTVARCDMAAFLYRMKNKGLV